MYYKGDPEPQKTWRWLAYQITKHLNEGTPITDPKEMRNIGRALADAAKFADDVLERLEGIKRNPALDL